MIKKLTISGLFPLLVIFASFAFAANSKPLVGTITPPTGTSIPNQNLTFATTYSDVNGYQDIKDAYFLINSSASGSKCFYAYYKVSTNQIFLRDSTNKAWLGGFTPGSGNVIENNQVKLYCSQVSVSGSGNILTIKWPVTPKPGFTGIKNCYLYVKDSAGAYQGWVKKGKWRIVNNHDPVINSITPSNGSEFLAGAKISIQINASDKDRDPLTYQFLIADKIVQDWSSLKAFNWQTSEADTGTVGITCNVKDKYGVIATGPVTLHIINPAVQDILKKVADNYSNIYDLNADLTLIATLNSKVYGSPDYNRYYFKAPNKEKTEAFSDKRRLKKTQAFITSGSNLYLIDTVNKTSQAVDLLTDANINGEQFNQMDIYYNQENFLNGHTVTKNYTDSDLFNFIVALDAIPKTQNNIYTKLELYVDYKRGLVTKIVIYKNDELPQITQAIETEQMSNGAWVISKLQKNPNLTAGNLIVTLSYDNIKINSGLTDADFDPAKEY